MSERRGVRALMARLEPVPGQHRPRPIRNGLILLGLVAVVLYAGFSFGYLRQLPLISGGGREVSAVFSSVPNLRTGTPVRVAGVKVGEVTEMELTADRKGVLVTMRVDDDVELHRDARAGVWWRTLLGRNMYVELEPGSASSPPLRGVTIPLAQTEAQVEFDQLFQPLDRSGRQGIRTWIREFDIGYAGGAEPARAIDRLAPTMRELTPGVGSLRGQRPGHLTFFVRNTSRAMGGLARHENDLGGLIESADVVMGVTAARSSDLGDTIRQGPATLRETRATMNRLRTTLDVADRVVPQLRPGARELAPALAAARPALRVATPLLRDARPTFRSLSTALENLRRAGQTGVPTMRGFTPTLERARSKLIPWLERRDEGTEVRNVDSIGPVFSILASAGSNFDEYGHLMRFVGLAGGERSLNESPCQTFFADPSPRERVACASFVDALTEIFGGEPPR